MKVAINITREPSAGITTTNLSLLDSLHQSDTSFVGIELNALRTFKSPVVYRHLSPDWFSHSIVTLCDYPIHKIVKRSSDLKEVQKRFQPIIDLIREILRKEKPDVLVVNGTYYMPWLLTVAAEKEKIPIVLWYAGVLTREVEHMTPKFRRIFNEMEKSIVKRAVRIVFPSKICQEMVCEQVTCPTAVKCGTVIPNPISPIYTRAKISEQSVERRIAFVGRYTPIKNIAEFCAIHKELLKQGWKHEATIVSDISKKELKKIPSTIKVVPSMSAEELKIFYSTQGLVISPSHFETFGNVPIECACLGIPVLVNRMMGCSDVLIDAGLEKMVIDFCDRSTVIKRIIELCGQHILPRQLNNLRKRVDTKYVANKILSAIRG